ncbi:hypothetical protein [Succinimonas amylolytica]|uniref:hypothetical protein n=1 Tax=Succinimonas amylolytica TaxID=83769 RepID=UPI000363A839|nr:hypothetical protein [Succinimonas amylolytica]
MKNSILRSLAILAVLMSTSAFSGVNDVIMNMGQPAGGIDLKRGISGDVNPGVSPLKKLENRGTSNIGKAFSGINSSMYGFWISQNPSIPMVLMLGEQSIGSLGYAGQIMGFTYSIQNNQLVISDMQGQQYVIPYAMNNNVLVITINNVSYNLVKYEGPLPQPGQQGFGK